MTDDGIKKPTTPVLEDDERRVVRRIAVDYDMHVDLSGDNVLYTGLIKDISSGGVFVSTNDLKKVGEVVTLRFTFPALPYTVEAQAEVQWVKDRYSEGGDDAGMGLRFLNLDEKTELAMNAYIMDRDVLMYEEGF